VTGDRCTGHCCRQFFLPFTPRELVKLQLTRVVRLRFKPEEIRKVAAMAVYLGDSDRGSHMYTCRHLNVITGDCTDYENRPDVCREFPYQEVCMHAANGCTWDAALCGTAGTSREPRPADPVPDLIPAEHLTEKVAA
jgi:Fe-S-cluster containining protein